MSDERPAEWIAVDWGTSHLRAWAVDSDGEASAAATADAGMARLGQADFEPALLALAGGWLGPTPVEVLVCGMAGARQGWVEAGYAVTPCPPLGAAPLARPTVRDPRLAVHVVPGLRQADPPDVMRGEETQIAGLLAGESDFDGVACLPGTHTKWAHVSAGEVVSFSSFMTGELFELLATASVLRHSVAAAGWDAAAFAAGVEDGMARPERLAGRLFGLRAAGLAGDLDPVAARARLSGLLIGAELAAARPYWLGRAVTLIGAPDLADAYAAALAPLGVEARRADAAALTLAGLAAARAGLHHRRRMT